MTIIRAVVDCPDFFKWMLDFMNYLYEVVKYNKNIPAMILMQNKPGWRCRTHLHWHKELELIYMIHGHLNICVNGREQTLDDNELFLCNSEEIHITDVRDDNEVNRYLVVMLSYDFMGQHFADIDSVFFSVDSNEEAKNEIIFSMKKIVDLCEIKNDIFVDIQKHKEILNIFYLLLRYCAVPKKNTFVVSSLKNFNNTKIVIEYIEKHYSDEITLNDMAELAELSPAYFSKYFKNITGISFLKYLNSVRLEYALKDMLVKNMSVTNAAFENGFPNVKSFINTCKSIYGYTPTQYKKHYSKQ